MSKKESYSVRLSLGILLIKLADCDIVTCTKRLNGGTNGLQERTKLFNYYKGIIGC